MAAPIKLRISWAPRDERFPRDDDALGHALHSLMSQRLQVGHPRPTTFVLRPDSVQIVDMAPILADPDPHRWIAALAGQEEVEAVAVVASLMKRRGKQVLERCASVYIEWPDGRWWWARTLLDAQGRPIPGLDVDVQRAVDGATKPMGLGAWFARARFQSLRLRAEPVAPELWN